MASASPPAASELDTSAAAADAVDALEAAVATLKANALTGTSRSPLRGRNVGILCEDPLRPEVFLLQRAASELGARVALVPSNLDEGNGVPAPEQTARVLGRLYDALICVDVPAQIVDHLREATGIPVISDVTGGWIAMCAARPDAGDDARYLLQALLMAICG